MVPLTWLSQAGLHYHSLGRCVRYDTAGSVLSTTELFLDLARRKRQVARSKNRHSVYSCCCCPGDFRGPLALCLRAILFSARAASSGLSLEQHGALLVSRERHERREQGDQVRLDPEQVGLLGPRRQVRDRAARMSVALDAGWQGAWADFLSNCVALAEWRAASFLQALPAFLSAATTSPAQGDDEHQP